LKHARRRGGRGGKGRRERGRDNRGRTERKRQIFWWMHMSSKRGKRVRTFKREQASEAGGEMPFIYIATTDREREK
jgi:hypothetical protein